MTSRAYRSFGAILAVVILAVLVATPVLAYWGTWSWGWTVEAYPVTGGVLWGEAGDSFWQTTDPNDDLWQVQAVTYAPIVAYSVLTSVDGEDRCNPTDPWVDEMSDSHTQPNSDYGQTAQVDGPYLDCGQGSGGHQYQVFGSHWMMATSTSNWEGSSGYAQGVG